jgi:hypothetical protein
MQVTKGTRLDIPGIDTDDGEISKRGTKVLAWAVAPRERSAEAV